MRIPYNKAKKKKTLKGLKCGHKQSISIYLLDDT